MQRKLKAKYRTVGPRKELVSYKRAEITGAGMELVDKQEEMDCYYVFFPHGHSVRFAGDRGIAELKRMGYHRRPKLVDVETGDVVDIGGQEYDFKLPENDQPDAGSIILEDDGLEDRTGDEPPIKDKKGT